MSSKILIEVLKDSVVVGDNILRVVVSNIEAVNDSVVRVDCFTYHGDVNDENNTTYRWYQLALGVDSFVETNEDGSMGILGDKFQEALTAKIMQTRNVAELAYILNDQNLEWDVEVTLPVQTDDVPAGVEGLKLAQGE
jgi:hypothetical protein